MQRYTYLPYGSELNGDSQDMDLIYFPESLARKVPGHKMRFPLSPEVLIYEADVITPQDARQEPCVAALTYYCLAKDYGQKTAKLWQKLINQEIMPLSQWLEENLAYWEAMHEAHVHPIWWAKVMFARIQYKAYKQVGEFINRKTEAELYFGDKDLTYLQWIWQGKPFYPGVLKHLGIEKTKNPADPDSFILRRGSQEETFDPHYPPVPRNLYRELVEV